MGSLDTFSRYFWEGALVKRFPAGVGGLCLCDVSVLRALESGVYAGGVKTEIPRVGTARDLRFNLSGGVPDANYCCFRIRPE